MATEPQPQAPVPAPAGAPPIPGGVEDVSHLYVAGPPKGNPAEPPQEPQGPQGPQPPASPPGPGSPPSADTEALRAQLASAEAAVALSPTLASDPDTQQLLTQLRNDLGVASPASTQAQPQPNGNQPPVAASGGPVAGANPDGSPKPPDSAAQPGAAPQVTSALLQGAMVTHPDGTTSQMTDEEFFSSVMNRHSIDIKTPEGKAKFVDVSNKWRVDSANLGQIDKEYKELRGFMESLPDQLLTPVREFANQGDWQSALKQAVTQPTFEASWSSVDDSQKRQLVNHYFPDQYSADDLSDLSDSGLKVTLQAVERLYEGERGQKAAAAKEQHRKILAHQQSYADAVSNSIGALKQAYPSFGEAQVQKVQDLLAQNALGKELFDNSGLPKDDAAQRIAFMLYGEEAVNEAARLASNKSATQVAAQYAGVQVPNPPQPSGAPQGPSGAVNPDVLAQLAQLQQLVSQGGSPFDQNGGSAFASK